MTTAQTTLKLQREEPIRGWLFYDGECPLCVNMVNRLAPTLLLRHFRLATFQTAWVQERLGLKPGDSLVEMKLLMADGEIFGGADAQVRIAKAVWLLWPLFVFAQLPGAMFLLRANYRWVAANRNCLSGVCGIHRKIRRHRTIPFLEIP